MKHWFPTFPSNRRRIKRRKVFALQDDLSMTLRNTNFADFDGGKNKTLVPLHIATIETRQNCPESSHYVKTMYRNFCYRKSDANLWENISLRTKCEFFFLHFPRTEKVLFSHMIRAIRFWCAQMSNKGPKQISTHRTMNTAQQRIAAYIV